jgi:hypothetical protein
VRPDTVLGLSFHTASANTGHWRCRNICREAVIPNGEHGMIYMAEGGRQGDYRYPSAAQVATPARNARNRSGLYGVKNSAGESCSISWVT